MARIVVRNQFMDVPDHLALSLAGLGAESYLRLEQLWLEDRRREYEQTTRQQRPVPQPDVRSRLPTRQLTAQPDEAAMRHEAVAELAKARGQLSW